MTPPAPDAARVLAAVRATWPPERMVRIGPFDVPLDPAGSRRAICARAAPPDIADPGVADPRFSDPGGSDPEASDPGVPDPGGTGSIPPAIGARIAAVEAARPGAVFGTLDGAEDALCAALRAAGYRPEGASALMAGPVEPLLGDLPPVSGIAHWPPLAICEAMWAAHGNGPASVAAAERAPGPKAAILLRGRDRASGALFVAVSGELAVLHMVLTLPDHRRQGVGALGLRHAAAFAHRNGAAHLALPVERDNAPALALYEAAGLRILGGYHYWRRP